MCPTLFIIQWGHGNVHSMTPGSYLCQQTVGETVSMQHSHWCSAVRQHSFSQHENVSAHSQSHMACVRAKRPERPTPGRTHPKYSLRYNGSKQISDGPDALWDKAERFVCNNRPLLFCLGSLSNVSSEITVSETFGKTWKGRGQQVRQVYATFWSTRESVLCFLTIARSPTQTKWIWLAVQQ